jgi:hypothetical protein
LDDFTELCKNLPEVDREIIAERARQKQQRSEQSEYHQAVQARVFTRRTKQKPELPDGDYQTYVLLKGKHYRIEQEDLDATRKDYEHRCKEALAAGHREPDWEDPELKEYRPGDTIKPQNDGEALLMVQDPEKFKVYVPNEKQDHADRIAQLLAENERLKMDKATSDTELELLRRAAQQMQEGQGTPMAPPELAKSKRARGSA